MEKEVERRTIQLRAAIEAKHDALESVEVARSQAEAANQSKTDFLAYLCHGSMMDSWVMDDG